MSDRYVRGHYVLGIEGLALLRRPAGAQARLREMAEIIDRLDEQPYAEPRAPAVSEVGPGYAGWAASYDEPGNDTIALEQPAVRALLDELPPGPVLDAACGTGRHAAYLAAAGRDVVGVDISEAMLARARAKLPGVELRRGELTALPFDDGAFGGALCALALSHLPCMDRAIAELARVLRPGGRLVISNPHPFATGVLGWRAAFSDGSGRRSTIPEHPHLHGAYLAGFAAAGLTARRLIEPALTREDARARSRTGHPDAFEDALTGVPAVIVWEAERSG